MARTIETEIIPRLVLARTSASERPAASGLPGSHQVATLTELVLAADQRRASAYIAKLRAGGVSVEQLYLDLLAPVARRLGELWTEDLCDFTQVTVGVCCLQQVLRELGAALRDESAAVEHGRRALLAPVPGEQHSFGLFMVAEFFRQAGWDVWTGPAETPGKLARLVRNEWFAVVGLSASAEARLDAMAVTIRVIRRASRNRRIGILVGGQLFAQRHELTALVGADATADDGRQAPIQARNLVAMLSTRS